LGWNTKLWSWKFSLHSKTFRPFKTLQVLFMSYKNVKNDEGNDCDFSRKKIKKIYHFSIDKAEKLYATFFRNGGNNIFFTSISIKLCDVIYERPILYFLLLLGPIPSQCCLKWMYWGFSLPVFLLRFLKR